MQENYLAKWLNNGLTEEELSEFKKTEEYASYQKIIAVSNSLEAPAYDVDQALDDLHKRTRNQEAKVVPLRKTFNNFIKAAAAIALILVGSYFYVNSLNKTVSTAFGEHAEVILPDASKIVLNADSEVSYNQKKWSQKRNISLEGEAFFKVAKGKRFTVTTEDGIVSVLGTHFNVESRKGFFEVTCYEGLVSVSYNGKEIKLPAGTSFITINGKMIPTEIPNASEPSWVHNESSFKSIPLKYVLDEFKRQYNVAVETKNIDLNELFTGTFSNTKIDLALQSITVPSQLKYKMEGDKVLFYAESAH